MRRLTVLCAVTAAATALICGPPVAASQPLGTGCAAGTDTWTSQAGDTLWSSGGNWSENAPPTSDQLAVLPTAAADNVELTSDATVCGLEMDAQTGLVIDAGKTLTSGFVTLTGGPTANAVTELDGQVTASSDMHVQDGYTVLGAADASTPVTESTATLEVDSGAHFTLSDSAVTLKASGLATLGGSGGTTHFDSNSTSDGDDSAKFEIDATAQLAGNLDSSGLDVISTSSTVIDTADHSWTVHGDAFSRFTGGTKITSSPSGGVYAIGNQDHVLVSGTITVASGATLNLNGTGTLTDGRYFKKSGAALATVSGHGTFAWTGGQITGHVDLAPSLTTVASGSGARHVSDPSFGDTVLTNAGTFTLKDGSLMCDDSKDSFVNTGRVTVTGGRVGANTSSAPPLQNASGGRWVFAPASTSSSKISNGSFRNAGILTISANKTLVVGNTFRQVSTGTTMFTVSSPTLASRLHAGGLLLGGTAHLSSAAGYTPSHATVTGLLKGGSRSGTFAHVVSTTHRKHTVWHMKYVGARVDAVLN